MVAVVVGMQLEDQPLTTGSPHPPESAVRRRGPLGLPDALPLTGGPDIGDLVNLWIGDISALSQGLPHLIDPFRQFKELPRNGEVIGDSGGQSHSRAHAPRIMAGK